MIVEIVLVLLAIFVYYYHQVTKQFGFFAEQGIPFSKPSFPFGSSATKQIMTGKISITDTEVFLVENEFPDEKIFGYFNFGQPTFVINDEELAKKIMIKDFEYFTDRRAILDANEINNAFMTNLSGAEWKQIRSLMSGVFTSGRLKVMFKHIKKVGENYQEHLDDVAEEGVDVDMRVVGGKMTLDAIATAGFGIETNSFKEPDNTFRVQALTLVGAPGYVSQLIMVKFVFMLLFPWATQIFKLNLTDKKAMNFFSDIVKKTYKHRIETGEKRNDIIDQVVAEIKGFKTKLSKKTESYESQFEKDAGMDTSDVKDLKDTGFSDETLLVSNSIIFFFAGFDTTTQGYTMCCNKLALHPDIQEKLYEEITEVIGDDEVTFDRIQDLKYMDMFIAEVFRRQGLVNAHERLCTKDYKVPGTNYVIPKDRFVRIYVKEMARAEGNFVNPGEFDPENCNPSNNPSKFAQMIFGQGPRNCIGMRYAMVTMKVALVYTLMRHRVLRCDKTLEELVLDPSNPNVFKGGVFVKIEKRV